MASTYTLNNGIQLIGTGDQSGTWGDTTNVNLQLIDTALDGQVLITLSATGTSGAPNDLPITDGTAANSDGRNRLVIFNDGGDLGGNAYVRLTPSDAEKIVYIRNNLTGSTRDLVVFQGIYNASNDYIVKNGNTAIVYFDGAGSGAVAANVFDSAQFDALTMTGPINAATLDLSSTLDVAGTATFTGNASFEGSTKTMAWNSASNKLAMDSAVLEWGADTRFGIYRPNTGKTYFKEDVNATYGLMFASDGPMTFANADGGLYNQKRIETIKDGAVELYHNAVKKIETTATGVTVSGKIIGTSLEIDGAGAELTLDANFPIGTENLAVGLGSLNSNAAFTGDYNTSIGANSGSLITAGSYNTFLGNDSGKILTSASSTTAVGFEAGSGISTNSGNTVVGANSMSNGPIGQSNTALGAGSCKGAQGSGNVVVGFQSGNFITGNNNIAIGRQAAVNSGTGSENICIGNLTMFANAPLSQNLNGTGNVAIGKSALELSGGTSAYNTSVGYFSLNSVNQNKDFNTAFGYRSGSLITTGEKNTILGSFTGNQTRLDMRTLSNHVVLSDGDGLPVFWVDNNEDVYIPGVYSNTSASAANVYVDSTGGMYRSTSSLRYKENIEESTHGLSEVMALRSVTYTGKNNPDVVLGGLIAEEVHSAGLPEFVEYDGEGRPDALHYGNMVALCVKAIQELKTELDAANLKINELLEK